MSTTTPQPPDIEAKPDPATRLAWEVEVSGMTCIVFAATLPKARWVAVRSYWEAWGRRRGEWPDVTAWRREDLDSSHCRFLRQQAWSPELV